MKKNYKIFFNSSARSSNLVEVCSKRIIGFIDNSDVYSLTYDTYADGTKEEIYSQEKSELKQMFSRATAALDSSDIAILEVSTHSLSQGYLLEKSLEAGKPTIVLYLKGCKPAFATGIHHPRLQVIEYSSDNVLKTLQQALSYAIEEFDIRFNMMLSPTLNNYLKQLAKKNHMSRSSCVRQLIRENMNANAVLA